MAALVIGCSPSPVADIVFVLDSSGSIDQVGGTGTFQNGVLGLTKKIVTDLTIGSSANQVGLIDFSDSPNLEIKLNAFSSQSPLLTAIDNTPYMSSSTYTGAALQYKAISWFNWLWYFAV